MRSATPLRQPSNGFSRLAWSSIRSPIFAIWLVKSSTIVGRCLSLREFFNEHGCTVLLMQELTRGRQGTSKPRRWCTAT